jgi:hypothetical protein
MKKNRFIRAEVSNRMILVAGVLIVLAMFAVPFGFMLYPRIAERLNVKHEKLELVFADDFEKESLSSEWPHRWGSVSLSTSEAKGSQSLRLVGGSRGYSSGGVSRPLEVPPPLLFEFDLKMGGEAFHPSAHALRGGIFIFVKGGGGGGGQLISFASDMKIKPGIDEKNVHSWKPGKWYHVRVRYEQDEKTWRVIAEVDGVEIKSGGQPLTESQKTWKNVHLGLHFGTGTSWFDNVKVFRIKKE